MSQSHWRQQKQRVINQLKAIIEGVDYSEEIEKIDAITRKNTKIKNFYGAQSEELKYDKDFEQNCIILGQYSVKPVKECTVREYFSLLQYVNDKNKRK